LEKQVYICIRFKIYRYLMYVAIVIIRFMILHIFFSLFYCMHYFKTSFHDVYIIQNIIIVFCIYLNIFRFLFALCFTLGFTLFLNIYLKKLTCWIWNYQLIYLLSEAISIVNRQLQIQLTNPMVGTGRIGIGILCR